MEELEKTILKYLRQTATIHIYSFPHFILEFFLVTIVLLLYVVLHWEVSKIYKNLLRFKTNTTFLYEAHSGSIISRNSSICSVKTHFREVFTVNKHPSTTVAYKCLTSKLSTNSQMGWVLPTHPVDENSGLNHPLTVERKKYAEKIASLTPEQFVKIDKERKLREKELERYMSSLATLCRNVVNKTYSAQTLKQRVEIAKENLQCNKTSLEGKYLGFKTDVMTKSLFNMLEKMITSSSLQNPLPFKGDFTTLALDVAALSKDSQHYFAEDIAKWDRNSSNCVTEVIHTVEAIKEKQWEQD